MLEKSQYLEDKFFEIFWLEFSSNLSTTILNNKLIIVVIKNELLKIIDSVRVICRAATFAGMRSLSWKDISTTTVRWLAPVAHCCAHIIDKAGLFFTVAKEACNVYCARDTVTGTSNNGSYFLPSFFVLHWFDWTSGRAARTRDEEWPCTTMKLSR